MKYQGACRCGKVRIGIDIDPFLIYNCHCSHCRAFASHGGDPALFHAGAAVWRWNVQVDSDEDNILEYEQTSANVGLFSMSRGRCRDCKDPMIEYCHRMVAPFVMVAHSPLPGLPPPDTNIFYNSGHRKGTGDLRTIHSDFGSLLYEVWIILIVAIPSIPRSIWSRFTRSNRKRRTPFKQE